MIRNVDTYVSHHLDSQRVYLGGVGSGTTNLISIPKQGAQKAFRFAKTSSIFLPNGSPLITPLLNLKFFTKKFSKSAKKYMTIISKCVIPFENVSGGGDFSWRRSYRREKISDGH
jgi:hypothetical protein